MRRSQSPPTSASTHSSSLNNTTDNTPTIQQESVAFLVNNERKDEWATELQPIPGGLELIATGSERCGFGSEDWESMLSESSQEQSIMRWIAGDVEDTPFGLKQLLHSGGGDAHNDPLVDFDANAVGLGFVDQGPNFQQFGDNILSTAVNNLGNFSGSGFVSNYNNGNGKQNAIFSSQNMPLAPVSLPSSVTYHESRNFVETPEEKPQIVNPQILMNQQQQHHQNANFLLPLTFPRQQHENHHHHHLLQPQPKRQNSGGSLELPSHNVPKSPFADPAHEFLLRNQQQQMGFSQNVMDFLPQHLQQKPLMVTAKPKLSAPGSGEMAHQHHALLDQLYKAAELVGTGNFSNAQGILARLNHQLSPVGKPLQRAAFYFKEALQLLLLMNNPVTNPPPRSPTHFDVIFKMEAYKVFSEVSPLIQFVNFTCNQALLEALDDADKIHIVDFDIGFGAQWASFMQELPMRSNRSAPSLKITAFASPSSHHPIELALMRENLTQFANEIGVHFELDVVNFDSLDQTSFMLPIFRSNGNEAVAVNFPIWSFANQPSALRSLLRFVKQLSPKVVVSLDRGCARSDLPFAEHILHALQSYINLLESLDAVNVTRDAVNKIEGFLLQPRIESTVLGRVRAPEKMPHWKTLFASAGFSPVTFSNFAETQAECVVKRTPVREFHVEKRQASLVLCWQRRELISASAWRC
ncbi:hypothetical protein JRO89_XS13G0055300 [Xanthoceras sorbifolium]|uniref:Scarecrow-like protein 6 n=1 Tax=Xanthoceras sorbifolium TaxID=99658 RepID=A0ABQ8H6Q9_9ROSI|nr:hypothetical protein JRO89_XS13G0055300 [Xanthoceras sorbifolium]